ncbi:MAG: tRNA (N(6)-L-threonylcarbamoyladenosine(37)-C(2))-methylthiotransferase MtaB [Bacteroidota bacterium]|nr:tRNA (N(6)-L-threonylcarbamoyladenosine(37)-C(2))-methylthiotransferase MtaB [Bacteroidota bacterium]
MGKKVAFHTLGCKLNFSETSSMAEGLKKEGYSIVDWNDIADIYIINSCTVTAKAEKKCRDAIKKVKNINPYSKVVVAGCYAEIKPEELKNNDKVDTVLGNTEKYKLAHYLAEIEDRQYTDFSDVNKTKEFFPTFSKDGRTRTFFKIQDGCDYFCTYCAIPYARGRNRYNTVEETIKTANEIAKNGFKEVVLTGINIGEFGVKNGESFFELIKELDKIDGIERYRISSIEPNLITDEIIEFVSKSNKFLPHFHIPLQSGSNTLLELMNRRYTTELFAQKVLKIKELMPNACVAADVIVGFPGETDELFNEATDFIESLPISYLHVFTYSDRQITKASKFKGQVSGKVKKERSKVLHNISDKLKENFYNSNINNTGKVLFESQDDNGFMHGFTDNYVKVRFPFHGTLVNRIKNVKITAVNNDGTVSVEMIE